MSIESPKLTNFQRYMTLFIVAFAAGVIFKVAYLREVFYEPLMQGLGVTHTELGLLSGAYGFTSMFFYFPGGIIADKFSPKKLVVSALLLTAALTFWYATIPSYYSVVAIMAGFAVSTILIFWAAMNKTFNFLGGEDSQGRMFGYAEGIKCASGLVASFGALWILEQATSAMGGLQSTLIFYGIVYVVIAILAFIFMPDIKSQSEQSEEQFSFALLVQTLKLPAVWFVTLIIFSCYSIYALQSYTTPYMQGLGVSTALVGMVGIIRQYGIGLLSSPIGGFIGDKIGSSSKAIIGSLILVAVCTFAIKFAGTDISHYFLIAMVICIAFMIFICRGIYFATMKEAQIPSSVTGSAIGFISVIAFTPDLYIYAQVGSWLDSYPMDVAYDMVWNYILLNVALAIFAGFGIIRCAKKAKQKASQTALENELESGAAK